MKKRILALFLALVLVLSLAACGKDKKNENENLCVIGDYQALYTGGYITKDYDGVDTIVIPLTFTNNSKEANSIVWTMFPAVTQNGQDLEYGTVFVSEESYDTISDGMLEDVEPGSSLDLALTYNLINLTDPVKVNFSDLMDKKTAELTIDVTALEFREGGTEGGETASEPSVELGEGVMNFDDYAVEYLGQELMMDADGNDTLAVHLNYTNLGTSADSFAWSATYSATQAGEELYGNSVYVDGVDLSDSLYEDVEPGDTLAITLTYPLVNLTDPVELRFANLFETVEETITVDVAALEPAVSAAAGDEEFVFDQETMELYAGDWHGVAEFYDCTGGYADLNETQCDIAARLIFGENGECTPYIRLCLDQPEDENFVIEAIEYDEEYMRILLHGTLNGEALIPDDSFVERDGDVLYIGASVDDGNGGAVNVLGCLRRLDDTWDYENDYPALPEGGVEFYKGKSFEERIALFGYDTALIPTAGSAASPKGGAEETAAADGIVTLQQLKDWKAWLYSVNTYENDYYKPTFEECVEAMGVEPAERTPEKWTDELQYYKWNTADDTENIVLTLKPTDDGTGWRYHSISWTGGVNG